MEQWANFIGQILGTALIVAFGLRKRKVQNKQFNHDLTGTLTREVGLIRDQVDLLKEIVYLHKKDLEKFSGREIQIISRIDRLEEHLPKIEDTLQKTLDFFERQKAKPLQTKPLPGGNTAIKPRKG